MKHKKVLGIFFLTWLVLSVIPSISVYGKMHKSIGLEIRQNTYLNIKHYRPSEKTIHVVRSPYTGVSFSGEDYSLLRQQIKEYHNQLYEYGVSNCWYHDTKTVVENNLIYEFNKKDDYLLENYVNATFSMFCNNDWGTNNYVDTDSNPQSTYYAFEATSQSYICIGTDNTAVAYNDYSLGAETRSEIIDDWFIEDDGSETYNISATAFFTFNNNYSIVECGWKIKVNSYYLLFTRDVFNPINVTVEDTISITITNQFTGGLLDNYGQVLANLFYGDDRDVDLRPTKVNGDIDDADRLYSIESNRSPDIYIGTSETAFSLTQYNLNNKVMHDDIDEKEQVIYHRSGFDYSITNIGYFVMDSDYDIKEIGWINNHEIYTSESYMVARIVLDSTWSFNAGETISIYLKLVIDQ
jgi:hypothetical protein